MTENSNNQIKYYFPKYAKVLVLLALLIMISIPMVEMMYLLGIKGMFSFFPNKITSTTGVNQYLANAIIMALMIPLLWSFKWTFSFSSKKRRTGYSIVAGYILIFYLSMFFLTKEQKFDFSTGKATKYYANTPEGMRYFDAPGFDPKYGIPLKPVNPNDARSEALHTRPPQKLDDPKLLFDFVTREPVLWYYVNEGRRLEFYDQSGFHPKYSQELKPVTPDVVVRFENQKKKLAKLEELRIQTEKREVEEKRQAETSERERQKLDTEEKRQAEAVEKERRSVLTLYGTTTGRQEKTFNLPNETTHGDIFEFLEAVPLTAGIGGANIFIGNTLVSSLPTSAFVIPAGYKFTVPNEAIKVGGLFKLQIYVVNAEILEKIVLKKTMNL